MINRTMSGISIDWPGVRFVGTAKFVEVPFVSYWAGVNIAKIDCVTHEVDPLRLLIKKVLMLSFDPDPQFVVPRWDPFYVEGAL